MNQLRRKSWGDRTKRTGKVKWKRLLSLQSALLWARAGQRERRHFSVVRSVKKYPAQEPEDSEACVPWDLQERTQGLSVGYTGEPGGRGWVDGFSLWNTEILKVGTALTGSVGMPELGAQPAVGQAEEHLKTRQNIWKNLIFVISSFKQLYWGKIDINCLYGTFLKSTLWHMCIPMKPSPQSG